MLLKIILGTIFIIGIITTFASSDIHLNEQYTAVGVKDKFIDNSGDNSHYVVITDKGAFEVDRPLFDIFNESRNADLVYSNIKPGEMYILHTYGYRIGLFYIYPIIVDVK